MRLAVAGCPPLGPGRVAMISRPASQRRNGARSRLIRSSLLRSDYSNLRLDSEHLLEILKPQVLMASERANGGFVDRKRSEVYLPEVPLWRNSNGIERSWE